MIVISDKERYLVQNLQDQEALCIEKYGIYEKQAKDVVLKNLFKSIQKEEQQHFDSLGQLLKGTVVAVNSNDKAGKDYAPKATYKGEFNLEDKAHDKFLCTDLITTEKCVASAYNFDLFQFGNSDIRKLLNDIETEEQNHAEKIHKYKTVNDML